MTAGKTVSLGSGRHGPNLVRTVVVSAAMAASTLALAGDKAQDLLRRSLSRSPGVNIVSIRFQRDPSGDGTYQRVKIERSADGKFHDMVLQPLRLYGVESVDDGDRNQIFFPDNRLIIDQPSSQFASEDVNSRIALISQNYRLKVQGQTRIAGRTATIVTATSRYEDLGTRRFYIDRGTGYPLRMDAVNRDGSVVIYYDTKDIQYPKSLDPSIFRMRPIGRVRRIAYNRPSTFQNAGIAGAAMGFDPVLPKVLPYGFKMTELQCTQNSDWHALVVRMTDGLVRATIYQWRSAGDTPDVKDYTDRSTRVVDGVNLLLVSELNARQRERLIDAFADRLQATPSAINLCMILTQSQRRTKMGQGTRFPDFPVLK